MRKEKSTLKKVWQTFLIVLFSEFTINTTVKRGYRVRSESWDSVVRHVQT